MNRTILIAAIAFVLGAISKTLAQTWAPPDEISARVKATQAEIAAEAAEDVKQTGRPGNLTNPFTPAPAKPIPLEERQVRALERIARAMERGCAGSVGAPTAHP
jgi:hypothetical protein